MDNAQFANFQAKLEPLTFVQLKLLRQYAEEMISSNHVGKAVVVHEEGKDSALEYAIKLLGE